MERKKTIQGFIIFLVLTSILVNVSQALETIDMSKLDALSKIFVEALKFFFKGSLVALTIGYLRNLLGFLENWFKANYSKEEIEYELGKLGETWMRYEAGILAISSWLPPQIAAAITFILDITTSTIKKLAS